MGYLISIIIFQTVFTLTLLLVNKNKDSFEKLLTLFISFILIHFIAKLSMFTLFGKQSPLYTLQTGFGFFYGPMLYITSRNALNNIKKKVVFAHLIPFNIATILYIVSLIHIYAGYTKTKYLTIYENLVWLELISFSIYPIITFYLLKKQKDNISNEKLKLLQTLTYIMLAFALIAIVIMPLVSYLTKISIDLRSTYVFMLAMVIAIILYRIKTFNTPLQPTNTSSQNSQKYSSSKLATQDLEKYQVLLEKFFEQEKPYLEPDLTLQTLSEKVQIPKHHLTQLLNTHLKKNFYQYVNEYRIKEVVINMEVSQFKSNIIDVAFNAGFNSKSSFNNYFKKITGKTPSEFKKEHSTNT